MNRSAKDPAASATHGAFVPLGLMVVTLLLWTAFQTSELIRQGRGLRVAYDSQTPALEQAQRIRKAADSLAGKTQKLADSGNPNARLVIDSLKQRGVTIDLSAKTAAPPL